ncbi:MAG: hypothetical protein GTN73_03220 [Candidatus Aminicenantes bacterium]|nr:hypothetical protein [Candidatus Aminicenantes bacterium]
MKKLVLGLLVLVFFGFVFAEEKYEITEVDIFSLGKSFSAKEISVYGVSVGDSMQEVLAKLKKKRKHVKYTGNLYSLDMGKDTWRILSADNKTVQSIILFTNFSSRLKGKTAEYFDVLSEGRLKSFVEECFGEPDYIHRIEPFGMYDMLYVEEGFEFSRTFSSNSIVLTTKEKILSSIETIKSMSGELLPKGKEVEEEIVPPKIDSKAGFRGVLWGASKEHVKKAETSEFMKEDKVGGALKGLEMLVYKADVAGLDGMIIYYFAKSLLTRARYIITESHSNKNLYLEDFKSIKSQLTKKYGSPERDDTIWSNDLYRDDPSEYGMAVSVGHLIYVAEWYPPESAIQLLLRGDNYKINLWVEYTSDALKEFEKKVREKAKKDIW